MVFDPLGLYIHIPFCRSKCPYCDFCSFPRPSAETLQTYVDALCREIKTSHPETHRRPINTIYFGGGTPTLLSTEQWEKIFVSIWITFPNLLKSYEVTSECNPATADEETLRTMRRLGIRRLSVGIQSAQDDELRLLGRIHTFEDAVKTVKLAHRVGFRNVSADLMFGIPGQTRESFADTLEKVTSLKLRHLSVYGLQIEEGTPFAKRKNLPLPDEETERAMYYDAVETLREKGFNRYEISNFAIPGYESRHNLKYWRREDYLGFGAGAHSCLGLSRFSNSANLEDYLAERGIETQTVSERDAVSEEIMLGLRLDRGINLDLFAQNHGVTLPDFLGEPLETHLKNGLLTLENNTLRFSSAGVYLSNTVLSDLLTFET